MVMVPYTLIYKEIAERFSRRFKYSYLKSMVEEVNHQFVLQELEKKKDITI